MMLGAQAPEIYVHKTVNLRFQCRAKVRQGSSEYCQVGVKIHGCEVVSYQPGIDRGVDERLS